MEKRRVELQPGIKIPRENEDTNEVCSCGKIVAMNSGGFVSPTDDDPVSGFYRNFLCSRCGKEWRTEYVEKNKTEQ